MTLRVGIASYEQMKARTLAVARGKRAHKSEPKIWFTSMESFAKILSDRNRALLPSSPKHNRTPWRNSPNSPDALNPTSPAH